MAPDVLEAGALTFDAGAHVYRLGDRVVPSVTQILAAAGVAAFTGPWFNAAALERGRAVHLAIALDVEGTLDESALDPALGPYLEAWRRFRRDAGIEVEYWEHSLADPVLGYAGTLDGIIKVPAGWRTVLDIKSALYPSVGPQVAAYLKLARTLYPGPMLLTRAALVLPGDGSYRLVPLRDRDDDAVFLAALRIFHWRRKHGVAD